MNLMLPCTIFFSSISQKLPKYIIVRKNSALWWWWYVYNIGRLSFPSRLISKVKWFIFFYFKWNLFDCEKVKEQKRKSPANCLKSDTYYDIITIIHGVLEAWSVCVCVIINLKAASSLAVSNYLFYFGAFFNAFKLKKHQN